VKVTVEYEKSRSQIDLPEGAAITDAIAAIGIPEDDVGFGVIRGRAVRKDYTLTDGDEVTLYQPIVGG